MMNLLMVVCVVPLLETANPRSWSLVVCTKRKYVCSVFRSHLSNRADLICVIGLTISSTRILFVLVYYGGSKSIMPGVLPSECWLTIFYLSVSANTSCLTVYSSIRTFFSGTLSGQSRLSSPLGYSIVSLVCQINTEHESAL